MANHPNRKRKIAAQSHDHDADYAALLASVTTTFASVRGPLFATDARLNDTYLKHLGTERGIHDCSSCRRFIESFGALVTIGEDGRTASAVWDAEAVPEFYQDAIAAMVKIAERARVIGPFLSPLTIWGTPKTGTWTHFAVSSPNVYKHPLLTAGQAMAAKREDFGTVARALGDFSPALIAEALRVLEAGHLNSSEKFVAPLHWLAALHAQRSEAKDARIKANILWRAIATAPAGYCHPRASVTGTLLEDIAAGLSFEDVKARFNAKVGSLVYQRPQVAPSVGNLAEAEKIVEKMGVARSLDRRFARLDECQTAWVPAAAKAAPVRSGGVFSHILPKGTEVAPSLNAPAAVVTWDKFVRHVLPSAEKIEALANGRAMPFIALTSATHADAPIVLKWGNPVAWYVYHGGSPCSQWGLLQPGWINVNAVVPLPTMWGEKPQAHLGEGFVLVLDGCADTRSGQGNALFPECLIGELHAVRSAIEAYSRRAELSGREAASACGLDVRSGMKSIGYRLRVTVGGLKTEYQIDRWD